VALPTQFAKSITAAWARASSLNPRTAQNDLDWFWRKLQLCVGALVWTQVGGAFVVKGYLGAGEEGGKDKQLPDIDTSVTHSARFWNYLLGGRDNYAVDREAAEQILTFIPSLRDTVRAERAFLIRAVQYLVGSAGIRQFLDIGTGLPTANNTHEVAQASEPQSRIVYVDNDPLVLAHARALLTSTPEGATDYLHVDVRDPGTILRQAARTLDFTQPVGLMLLGILNFVTDTDEAHAIVDRLLSALPSGSYLVP
jgi:hypothetical protein